jgi:hypothetical protein
MAHFQERRLGNDRSKFDGKERRKSSKNLSNEKSNLEFIERARFKAWLVMTDKDTQT